MLEMFKLNSSYLVVSGGDTHTVRKDEGIGAIKASDIPPPYYDSCFLAKQERVEAQVVDTQIQPPLSRQSVMPVTVE